MNRGWAAARVSKSGKGKNWYKNANTNNVALQFFQLTVNALNSEPYLYELKKM